MASEDGTILNNEPLGIKLSLKRPQPTNITPGVVVTSLQSRSRVNGDSAGEASRYSLDDGSPGGSSSGSANNHMEAYKPPKKKKKKGEEEGYDWTDYISDSNFVAACVIQIKHAPLSRMWENISEGMKLEVENKDVDCRINETAFWVASVIKIQGYYVLLRYEGFGSDSSGDFWIHLCSESIHHVGWCANQGKPLIPPKSIAKKFTDWRSFLVHRLTGARTLPAHFLTKLEAGLKSVQKVGDILEVVDKNQISQLKVATVRQVVGRRLHVEYWDSNGTDAGFWCHEESRLIHPVGWARTIGHKMSHPSDYNPPMLPTTPYDAEFENMKIGVGMKLEAIDPLNLSAICAATIKQVLRRGYVMVRIDCYEEDSSGFDWFCYHISSNAVFPCGFAKTNNVTLTPPSGWDRATFTWDDYFRSTDTIAAPIKPKEKVLAHGFKEGMKIEAADLMDPRLICVATVGKVVGRLLKIHFDGWDEEYDQWMDARSPDIYPIGWCELVKHRLEPPRPPAPVIRPPLKKGAKKGKKKGAKQTIPKIKPVVTQGRVAPPSVNHPSAIRITNSGTGAPKISSVVNKLSNNGSGLTFNGCAETSITMANTGPAITTTVSADVDNSISVCDSNQDPMTWNILEVAQYLKSNDCAAYCEFFTKNNIDGKKLFSLSKDDFIPLTGGKVGPALKIFDLIQQLKAKRSKPRT